MSKTQLTAQRGHPKKNIGKIKNCKICHKIKTNFWPVQKINLDFKNNQSIERKTSQKVYDCSSQMLYFLLIYLIIVQFHYMLICYATDYVQNNICTQQALIKISQVVNKSIIAKEQRNGIISTCYRSIIKALWLSQISESFMFGRLCNTILIHLQIPSYMHIKKISAPLSQQVN